jgi:EmrB/QacA subfamily drug resistance transporter
MSDVLNARGALGDRSVSSGRRPSPTVILAVLATAGTVFSLNQSLVIPALPELQQAFHTSQSGVTWIVTANLLSASVFTPILGRLGDMFGKQRMLIVAMLGLVIGTFVSAIAPSLAVMLMGRVIAGVAGGIFPLAFAIVRDEFPPERAPGSIGIVSCLLGIGGGFGLVLPGPIINAWGFRWLFWLPFIISTVTVVLIKALVPESPNRSGGTVSVRAAVVMASGLSMVLIAISQSSDWGWGSWRTLGLLALGLVGIVGWIQIELRSRSPLIDMRMMRMRGVLTTNLAALLLGAGMYGLFTTLPTFVQSPPNGGYGFEASVTMAGLFMLPTAAFQLVVAPLAGTLDRVFGPRNQLLGGAGIFAVGLIVLTVAHDQQWEVFVATSLIGLGLGASLASLANLIVRVVSADQTGAATGMNTVMRNIGGAIGSQVVITLIAASRINQHPTDHGYTVAFAFLAATAVATVLAGLLIPTHRRDASVGRASHEN